MRWYADIERVRQGIMRELEQRFLGFAGWTLTAKTSSMGDTDAVQVADGDSQKRQRPVGRLEQWGLRSLPVAKVRSLWLRIGTSNVIFIGILPTKGYGPTDLNPGEVCLYSEQVERGVYLTQDGDNVLAAKSGRTVQVAGDGYKMPLWDSGTGGFVVALNAFVTSLVAMVNPNVSEVVAAATALQTAMSGASNFSSENATNG